MRNEQGFSLVELLIVVAIIAIIAAIAVPSLLTSRMAANEAGGIQACRTLGSAEIAFAAASGQQYALIADLVTNQYVDGRFSNAATGIGGYIFAEDVDITDLDTAQVVGGPVPALFGLEAQHQTGMARYDYRIGADQVVRWGTTASPNKTTDDPLAK